jgi:hypothetical protein
MSGRKYDVIPQNGDCSRESNVYFGFSKKSPLSNCNFVTELNMEKIHLQIMLSTLVRAISKDWQCSAPKRSGKTEHFAGRCSANPGSLDALRANKGAPIEVV